MWQVKDVLPSVITRPAVHRPHVSWPLTVVSSVNHLVIPFVFSEEAAVQRLVIHPRLQRPDLGTVLLAIRHVGSVSIHFFF